MDILGNTHKRLEYFPHASAPGLLCAHDKLRIHKSRYALRSLALLIEGRAHYTTISVLDKFYSPAKTGRQGQNQHRIIFINEPIKALHGAVKKPIVYVGIRDRVG